MVESHKNNENFRIITYHLDEQNNTIKPFFSDFKNKNSLSFLATINYFKFLSVTIQSYISNHLNEKTEFIIITNQLNEKEFKKLLVKKENLFFTFVVVKWKIDLNKFSEWGWNKKWSSFIFCKLILTNKIFKEFKKILFVDSDCIFLKNISELFEIKMKKYSLAGCLDFPAISLDYLKNTFSKIKNYNFKFREKIFNSFNCEVNYYIYINKILRLNSYEYMNCGIILFNVENIKDFSNSKTWIKDLMVLEQDMLNIVYRKNKKIISPIYNYPFISKNHLDEKINSLISEKAENEWLEAFKNKKIVHFYMSPKPWESMKIKKNEIYSLWFKYAKKTPYWLDIKKNIKENNRKKRYKFLLKFISFKWILLFKKITTI